MWNWEAARRLERMQAASAWVGDLNGWYRERAAKDG